MDLILTDETMASAQAVAAAIRPTLRAHPVPQSDPRTRGWLFGLPSTAEQRAYVLAVNPVLAPLPSRLAPADGHTYLIAVNETPPGLPDHFLMRPHLARRWTANGFTDALPDRVTMMFLDFPAGGARSPRPSRRSRRAVSMPDALPTSADLSCPLGQHGVRTEADVLSLHGLSSHVAPTVSKSTLVSPKSGKE